MKHLIKSSLLATAILGGAGLFMLSSCNNKTEQGDNAAATEETEVAEEAPASENDTFAQVANIKAEDIQVLPSGLKYVVLEEGTGANPTAEDTVEVYYTGKLTDGTIFDSTDLHGGDPIQFPLNRVIPGWTEGIQLMKEGGKYVFYIPGDLAYGEQGIPGVIPANAPLIFEVQLLRVVK